MWQQLTVHLCWSWHQDERQLPGASVLKYWFCFVKGCLPCHRAEMKSLPVMFLIQCLPFSCVRCLLAGILSHHVDFTEITNKHKLYLKALCSCSQAETHLKKVLPSSSKGFSLGPHLITLPLQLIMPTKHMKCLGL